MIKNKLQALNSIISNLVLPILFPILLMSSFCAKGQPSCEPQDSLLNELVQLGDYFFSDFPITISVMDLRHRNDKVDLSFDGNRVVIGSPYYQYAGYEWRGKVRVLDWNGQSWVQVGQDFIGENSYDEYGRAVAISGDGSRIFIGTTGHDNDRGKVQVYEWDGNTWTQLGEDLEGPASDGYYGEKISTNHDGSRMLIGSANHQNNNGWPIGLVQVFEWNNNNWIQLGQSMMGDDTYRLLGNGISMSADGQSIAVSDTEMPFASPISIGRASVFSWNENDWVLKGQVLLADENYTGFGESLSLSADGNRLAVGEAAFGFENGQHGPGRAMVYEFEASEWIPLGSTILGAGASSYLGTTVSLTYDGNRLAIGEPRFGNGIARYGRVQLFEWNESDWDKIASDIIKQIPNHQMGYNIALSGDGNAIAVGGSVHHDSPGSAPISEYCHTSVYRCANTINFFSSDDTYCVQDDSQYPLTGGWPGGGTYSGAGVIFNNFLQTYTFNPSLAEIGNHTLHYSLDEFGSDSIMIEVVGPPTVSLSLPDTLFLNLEQLENIEGTGFPVGGTYGDATGAIGTIVGGQYLYINKNLITDGLYNISYQYSNEFGCTAEVEQAVEIVIITSVGSRDLSDLNLRIFPNPTTSALYITGEAVKEIQVFDLLGKKSSVDFSLTNYIDLSSYPSGVYILNITLYSGETVRKLIEKI